MCVLGGCVNAKDNFDQFADRVGFIDASTVDRPPSTIFDITGTFLYSVRGGFETSNDPAFYIQFLATFTLTDNGGSATLDGELLPLCTFSTCTERSSIPPALVAPQTTVASDGTFAAEFGGTLPAGANPFSGTSQALTTFVQATIVSADLLCGDVTGSAAGLDLAGSTFAAIRVTDTTPANLPAPIAACPTGGPDAGVDAMPPDAPIDAGGMMPDAPIPFDAQPDA